jgi:hypothetical protein
VVADRCQAEGGRLPSVVDMAPALRALMGW